VVKAEARQASAKAWHRREIEIANGSPQLKGEPVEAVVEGDGGAVDLKVAAFGRCTRHVGRRADVLVALVRHERLNVGARGDVEAAARLEHIGSVVFARVFGKKGGPTSGAKFQGMAIPVGDSAQAGAHVERRVALALGALEDVVGGQARDFGFRKNDKATDADAGWVVGLDVEELRRAPIAQRLGLDAEHIGIIAAGRQLEGRDILRRVRLGAPYGNPVQGRDATVGDDDAVDGCWPLLLGVGLGPGVG
jgi:hypothetical protein